MGREERRIEELERRAHAPGTGLEEAQRLSHDAARLRDRTAPSRRTPPSSPLLRN